MFNMFILDFSVAMTACADVTKVVNGVVKFNDIKTNRNIPNLSYFKKMESSRLNSKDSI